MVKQRGISFYLKAILAFLAAAGLLGAIYVYLVYNGYCQLNHPSKTKYPIRGVDVSHYQGVIDWDVLAQEEIRFAYIKATEGSSHVDPRFAENWVAAHETELDVGAYHFFSFDSPGESQAENFIRCVADASADNSVLAMLPPVVDVEYYADKRENPPEPEAVRKNLQRYLDLVGGHYGMTPVIYSTEDVWEPYLKGHFDQYPLWIRNVMTRPPKDAGWTFWQYSNRARLRGYSGQETFIDMNVFCGSSEEWEDWKVLPPLISHQSAISAHPAGNNGRRRQTPYGSLEPDPYPDPHR